MTLLHAMPDMLKILLQIRKLTLDFLCVCSRATKTIQVGAEMFVSYGDD
jgi:hypothetical protein